MSKQINTNTKKRLRPKKRLLGNKTIVIIKIASACVLFFACALFFFNNIELFVDDLRAFNPFPVIFFAGLVFVIVYIVNLTIKIEDNNLYLADRLNWLYKAVFTITILAMIVRILFAEELYRSMLNLTLSFNILTFAVALCVASGVVTLLTPKIVDNDNDEF